MSTSPDLYSSAASLYVSGQFAQALATLEPLLKAKSVHQEALNLAAVCLGALNRLDEAEIHLRRLIEENPTHADAHCNFGTLLRNLGRLPEAEAAYRRAVEINPGHAECHYNLGNLLKSLDRLDEAEAAYRGAIAIEPGHADAHRQLGFVLHSRQRLAEAETVFRQVTVLEPNDAKAHLNLGVMCFGLGRLPEAEAAYQSALALDPNLAMVHLNLGVLYFHRKQVAEAEAAYQRALALQPNYADAHYNLALLFHRSRRLQQAEGAYRHAIAAQPGHTNAVNNLGSLLIQAGLYDQGIALCRQAVDSNPGHAAFHSNLAYILSFGAEDGRTLLDECLRWSARHEAPLRAAHLPHGNDRTPGRRLRIGYVSPDFRDHCQAFFTMPVLSQHDHLQFEIFCYSDAKDPDAVTQRLKEQADVWREVHPLDDAQLAQCIREDGIDILVDLTMHMDNGRPQLFARKPAPVQVAWLAYPGTTGIDAMDYRLTDPHLDPAGTDDQYSEHSVRLPDAFWCYAPLADAADEPPINALPAAGAGRVTFGSLNNPGKITDRTLRMWAAVLDRVEGSELVLLTHMQPPQEAFLQRLRACGIDPQRVLFAPFQARKDYLRIYNGIDIALDTFPYNGHTTSLDAFWMGVPVVSRVGHTAVGRGGLSQLMNLGLGELAADSDQAFADIAVQLAKDLPRLGELRQGLRARMKKSPLMDAPRFARNIEEAYREMWQNWCQAEKKSKGKSTASKANPAAAPASTPASAPADTSKAAPSAKTTRTKAAEAQDTSTKTKSKAKDKPKA